MCSENEINIFGDPIQNEDMDRWTGSIAVVTGASAGIGASLCRKLLQRGVNVVGLARRLPQMEALASDVEGEPGKFYPKLCDLSSEQDIIAVFQWIEEELGGVSIMVNNAGFMANTTLIGGTTEDWRSTFEVNVIGLCVCTREAIASMKRHDLDGHVVQVNSVTGHVVPIMPAPIMNVYPASKHAVSALAEILRQELNAANFKIKISSVSPGLVATEFFSSFPEEVSNAMAAAPFLKAEDVADACLYILSTPPHVQIADIIIKPQGEAF